MHARTPSSASPKVSRGGCEPQGFCSFPDADCPGGRKFEPNAGGGLEGTCVEIDAGVPDAPACGELGMACCASGSACGENGVCAGGTCRECVTDVVPGSGQLGDNTTIGRYLAVQVQTTMGTPLTGIVQVGMGYTWMGMPRGAPRIRPQQIQQASEWLPPELSGSGWTPRVTEFAAAGSSSSTS